MAASAPPLALVSGTTAGIGLAVARQLLAGGWTVVGLARRESPLAEERYRHVQIDLRDRGDARTAIQDFSDYCVCGGFDIAESLF